MAGGKLRGQPAPSLSLFKDSPRIPINGVGRLPAPLTINSITEYPVFRYNAGGGLVTATEWNPWGYGEALPVVSVATPPTLANGSPALGPLDDSVLFNTSDYYQAAGNTFADVTTEDFVIEFVFKMSATATVRIINKRDGASKGYEVYVSPAGGANSCYIADATGNSVTNTI